MDIGILVRETIQTELSPKEHLKPTILILLILQMQVIIVMVKSRGLIKIVIIIEDGTEVIRTVRPLFVM